MELKSLYISLFLIQFSSYSQSVKDDRVGSCWNGSDIVFNSYADSLNFISDQNNLPDYLVDYLFDWRLREYMNGCINQRNVHNSFRKAIIQRVTNEESLRRIIESECIEYDRKYDPELLKKELTGNIYYTFPDIPHMDMSWRDLARKRLEKIRELKESFN